MYEMLGHHFTLDEKQAQRFGYPTEEIEQRCHQASKAKGMMRTVYLGRYLSKEQQQKGKKDSQAQKLQPFCCTEINDVDDGIVEQDDYAHIDEVVPYQDGGQETFGVGAEMYDMAVAGRMFLIQFVQFGRTETEECRFAARYEG